MTSSTDALRSAIRSASDGLVERESLVELVVLAAVAGEHLLVLGPPGTAKSEATRRISRALGGRYFEYLLGRFTEPTEIFGPVDLKKLREGIVETDTRGMLPEADIAFLDEVFLGSTAILNTLLGVLNERRYRRGHTDLACPLRICVGASNGLPDDPALAAFADRFLVRVFVDTLPDTRLEEMLAGGWQAGKAPLVAQGSLSDLDEAAKKARSLDLAPVRPRLAEAIRRLRKAGIDVSDRRAVKLQRLVAAAAVLAGREVPTEADLWPIISAVPTAPAQVAARDALHDLIGGADSHVVPAAALAISAGPAARATLLVERADGLLGESDRGEPWRLRVEGILRDVDAGFVPGKLPAALSEARAKLLSALA